MRDLEARSNAGTAEYEAGEDDLDAMRQFASSVSRSYQVCASMGIAALVPDSLTTDQVLSASSPTAACRLILLLRHDMDYGQLESRAAEEGFRLVARRENAEMWAR